MLPEADIAFATRHASEESAMEKAGAQVLALYDTIKRSGPPDDALRATLMQTASALREKVEDNAIRAALLTVADVMPFWTTDIRFGRSATYAALLQYGEALADNAEWELAKKVYVLIANDAELDYDLDAAAQGYALAGMAFRMCADWDNSAASYARAIKLGVKNGDSFIVFRARGGLASNKRDRGDIPGAERELLSVIRSAEQLCPEAVIHANATLATVAQTAHQYERAITLSRRTLALAKNDHRLRTKALVDIANVLTDFGLPEVAREALQLVVATAPGRYVRVIALLNLFTLAVNAADPVRFDTLREQLRNTRLTPKQQTQFAILDAQGLRRLGYFDRARESLAVALQLAESHNFFQFSFEVEAETKQLHGAVESSLIGTPRCTPTPANEQARPMSSEIRRAVDDIHSLTASMSESPSVSR
jgi:tetratricopeptide (TPR) repeat protein